LRLHGFKSFADPTRFVFQPGVTAVIGPNGSGKSNMADAIRWVLGEQSNRSLRTRRADDVIFAGSDARKPVGLAEAVLVLDNTDHWLPIDFDEVSIARRTYRNGDSEYLINGARSRLRDVTDLLAGGALGANELVVVGQGTVDAALSLRPEERRQLFEEAAGVKGLQVRRNESLARLAKSRDNLSRVADLVGELRPQVRRLALQAAHQQEHQALVDRARALLEESFHRRERDVGATLAESRRVAARAEADGAAARSRRDVQRRAIGEAEQRYWAGDAQARATGQSWESARETAIRAEQRTESAAQRRDQLAAEILRLEAERAALVSSAVGPGVNRDELALAEQAAADAEAAMHQAAANFDVTDERLRGAEQELADIHRLHDQQMAARAQNRDAEREAAARLDRLESDIAVAERSRDDLDRELATARQAATAAATTRDQAEREQVRAIAVSRDAQGGLEAANQTLGALRAELERTAAELEALRAADSGPSLASSLEAEGWPGLDDALAGVAPAARATIEAVIGGLAESFRWAGSRGVPAPHGQGVARLLLEVDESLSGRDSALAAVGASQTLDELAALSDPPAILRHTVIAPDRATLLGGCRDLPPGWTAATLEGDVADSRGLIVLRGTDRRRGQREQRSQKALTRRIAELEEEVARLGITAGERQTTANQTAGLADAAVAASEAAILVDRRARHELADLEERADRLNSRLAQLTVDLDEARKTVDSLPAADGEPALRDGDAVLARLQDIRTEHGAAAELRDRTRSTWHEARERREALTDAARRHEGAPAARESALAETTGRLSAVRADHAQVVATLASQADELATLADAARIAAEARARAESLREEARAALLEAERIDREEASSLGGFEQAQQEALLAVAHAEEALASLGRERELAEESLPTGEAPSHPSAEDIDWVRNLESEELAAELRKARRTLAQIGSVNPFAVAEHTEVSSRLTDLETQQSDLLAAIEATEELGLRLAHDINDRFQAAFTAIGVRFEEYCRLLFAGGSASLELGDGTDGEAGIEIAVRPPGKRLQRLALLSGGERALTGVALLFAMLSVNPVPFCVLDEVDAALDEANIGRFADALRRLAADIDFVVITHNRATIETADTIYGVTMTDAAVSRVVSLRLADIPLEVTV
jgi:chromosome segregation protein